MTRIRAWLERETLGIPRYALILLAVALGLAAWLIHWAVLVAGGAGLLGLILGRRARPATLPDPLEVVRRQNTEMMAETLERSARLDMQERRAATAVHAAEERAERDPLDEVAERVDRRGRR